MGLRFSEHQAIVGVHVHVLTSRLAIHRAIACGVTCTVLCSVRLALCFEPVVARLPFEPSWMADPVTASVLTVFWVLGAAFNTEAVKGVFFYSANGYISTWYVTITRNINPRTMDACSLLFLISAVRDTIVGQGGYSGCHLLPGAERSSSGN